MLLHLQLRSVVTQTNLRNRPCWREDNVKVRNSPFNSQKVSNPHLGNKSSNLFNDGNWYMYAHFTNCNNLRIHSFIWWFFKRNCWICFNRSCFVGLSSIVDYWILPGLVVVPSQSWCSIFGYWPCCVRCDFFLQLKQAG